ncbi:MAG: hypothetical protein CO183_00605 [Candidatus Zambryskibacteria bacterium CG_4_9_14_3_um_filter_42_9]|uniref:Uncharacterized protein n=1 Tax=Candidatus Zambryskibacteria bacterium CG22_combo_CG10-13_8_21_14_all_42_17 TaxID=1975118 RepID=A0A2H0BCN2_9BACT|nr:MAG: hypothetical protein COX06_03235 [Candidatus Zambryskibacteria bacterium CG22_combo_CG10-13_8_21_14_all_42_17]PJA36976.1 MAG: hypothetical protein CO183_00605 [Candidatus Zambryskibacteria bacterium CG_4_9_14_3_um_filter_42_9]
MQKEGGFIGWLILVIIALALLKYFFNWSVFDLTTTEQGRDTINYIKDVLVIIWSYVKIPLIFVWQRLVELIPSLR